MPWIDEAAWWHVYPLGFCGAPIRDYPAGSAPRLDKLTHWLDYVIDLGATGLLLGPVFTSETHGYDTLDHYRIDPRLGDEAAFDRLLAACRDRGLRIVLDGVFNHVGAHHPWLERALREGPTGQYADFFRVDWSDPANPAVDTFEGHETLAALNHDSPKVADFVTGVMNHWLDKGIAGWRLDAAYAVATGFWARVLPRVRDRHPDAWILGEVIHGDYAEFVSASTVDSVTQYELWKAIWSSLSDKNFFELDWAMSRHNDFLDAFVPSTFVGNHDVERIASLVGNDGLVCAMAILCTIGGIPSIYYGDEQAFRGTKGEGWSTDDDIRPAFPESPDQLAPFGWPVFRAHQQLLALRRARPWLATARTKKLALTNTRLVFRVVAADHVRGLTVGLDISDKPHVWIRDGDDVLFEFSAS